MKRIAIIGAGDLGKQIAQHVESDDQFEVAGFFDDYHALGKDIQGKKVLGGLTSIVPFFKAGTFDGLLLGVGYSHLDFRERIFNQINPEVPFVSFVHSQAIVHKTVKTGAGCVVLPGCIIDVNVTLGNNLFLYNGCIISHDCQLQGHSFLAPSVKLAGFSTLGKRCFLGIGTIVINNILIGDDVRTGAGTVITKDISIPGTYVGAPFRRIN